MASPRSAGAGAGGFGGDEAIWRKLREAGLDEDSIRRQDKSALIAYISRLETEIYDYQHNLGLILLERKELNSEYEKLKASSEAAEIMLKRERAVQQSALAETRKREENLKKSLGIQKECVANLEKAVHDMRGETAEIKVSYELKLAEALQMMETAQKKSEWKKYKYSPPEFLPLLHQVFDGVAVDGSTAYAPGEELEDKEQDAEEDDLMEINRDSTRSHGSLKRASSTSTTATSPSKKIRSPTMKVMKDWLGVSNERKEIQHEYFQRKLSLQ